MFCYNCGKEIADTAQFCGFCGAKMKSAAAPAPAPTSVKPSSPTAPQKTASMPVRPGSAATSQPQLSPALAAMSDYERTLWVCRSPLMYVLTGLLSLFGFLEGINVVSLVLGGMGEISYSTLISLLFNALTAASFLFLAVGAWMTVIGVKINHSRVDKGLATMKHGAVFGAVAMGVVGADSIRTLLVTSGDDLLGQLSIFVMLFTVAVFVALCFLYRAVAQTIQAYRYNLALISHREVDGLPYTIGNRAGVCMLITGIVLVVLAVVMGDTLSEALEAIGLEGGTTVVVLLIIALAAVHIVGAMLMMMQYSMVMSWKQAFTQARANDNRLR